MRAACSRCPIVTVWRDNIIPEPCGPIEEPDQDNVHPCHNSRCGIKRYDAPQIVARSAGGCCEGHRRQSARDGDGNHRRHGYITAGVRSDSREVVRTERGCCPVVPERSNCVAAEQGAGFVEIDPCDRISCRCRCGGCYRYRGSFC